MRIKIDYRTGDSFGSHDEIGYVDLEWSNIEKANESLQRIKNHYEYFQNNSDVYRKPKGEIPKGVVWENEHRVIMLELISDDGSPYLYSPFWVGYFEKLYSAKIVFSDNSMIYKP